MEFKQLLQLAKTVAKAKPSAPVAYSFGEKQYSYADLNDTLREELNGLAGTYRDYQINKNTIFALMEQTINDVVPERVMQQYSQFAEIKTFAQGEKPIFTQKTTLASRRRAKTFIGKVGLAGLYEVFKLDGRSYEVTTNAIGGAAQIGFEEFLDGRVDFAEVTKIIMDGMDELIYKEVAAALKASINQLPPANRVAAAGFDENAMDRLIQIASAYGTPTIYCTYEFAVRMIPQEAWRYTESMKSELWNTGRLASYKGTKVVIIEQGFEDETNERKVIDPGYAWIIPTGADGKPVKIAFEGGTIVQEFTNVDQSRELQVYKKVGVTCILANNICAYCDTSLLGKMYTWSLDGVTGKVATYDGRKTGTLK